LNIALELVTPANIGEVIVVFKKEMNRTQTEGFQDANQYRRILVKAIHQCAVRFPDVLIYSINLLIYSINLFY
jgi:coatomer subunit beta